MSDFDKREKLRELLLRSRAESGKSQQQMANLLGVKKNTIQNWESGKSTPRFVDVQNWFAALGQSVDIQINKKVPDAVINDEFFKKEINGDLIYFYDPDVPPEERESVALRQYYALKSTMTIPIIEPIDDPRNMF